MRVLLDECIPRGLRRELPGHEVRTVPEMGWASRKNGELLRLAVEAAFDVFVTMDKGLRYQQNLKALPIAVLGLVATSNRLKTLLPFVSDIQEGLGLLKPGEYRQVGAIEVRGSG
jgi:hypothetical protein